LSIQLRHGLQSDFDPFNFLSYFTVLSNLAAAFVMTALAIRPRLIASTKFTMVRGMATLWMLTTAVFFSSWISPSLGDSLRHVISPVVLVADWLLNPGRRLQPGRFAVMSMVPPGLYLGYTMTRGLITGWYPYYFLDPSRQGYWAIAGLVLIVTVIMAACGVLLASSPSQDRVSLDRTSTPESRVSDSSEGMSSLMHANSRAESPVSG
jgi:hypothetical protein